MSKLIRRALIASGLFISAAVAFSPTAFAADTADVTIEGNVASTLAIAVTPGSANTNLDLAPDQTGTEVKVADFTMGTNSSQGLKLTPSGSFNLNNGVGGAGRSNIPFTVAVGVGTDPAGAYVATGSVAINTGAAKATTTPYALYIKYSTADDFQDPGAYEATITLDVADN